MVVVLPAIASSVWAGCSLICRRIGPMTTGKTEPSPKKAAAQSIIGRGAQTTGVSQSRRRRRSVGRPYEPELPAGSERPRPARLTRFKDPKRRFQARRYQSQTQHRYNPRWDTARTHLAKPSLPRRTRCRIEGTVHAPPTGGDIVFRTIAGFVAGGRRQVSSRSGP